MNTPLQFPRDLLRFLYWIFFRPITLQRALAQVDPSIGSAASLFARGRRGGSERTALAQLAAFYIILAPCLLGLGLALVLSASGLTVNRLELTLYLVVGVFLCLSFSPAFCIAFLIVFSPAAALLSSSGITPALGIFVSFGLGLAYGLVTRSLRWGLIASLVYTLALGFVAGLWTGLAVGLTFLFGYFRLPFYLVEAPLVWLISLRAAKADAVRLWRWQPVCWDELVWLPLPGLARHLRALIVQDNAAAQEALALVKGSFKQGWAVERAAKGREGL